MPGKAPDPPEATTLPTAQLVQNRRFANNCFLLIHIYTEMSSFPFKNLRLPRKQEETQPGGELLQCQCLPIRLPLTLLRRLWFLAVSFLGGSWLLGTKLQLCRVRWTERGLQLLFVHDITTGIPAGVSTPVLVPSAGIQTAGVLPLSQPSAVRKHIL